MFSPRRRPRRVYEALLVALSVLSLGCVLDRPSILANLNITPLSAIAQAPQSPQALPLSAQLKVKVPDRPDHTDQPNRPDPAGEREEVIQLEVAQTYREQAIGLMFRRELAADRGMLFPFEPARPVNFWMKNTWIALDMVFLRSKRVVGVWSNVQPCQADPCPGYGPSEPVDAVIELAAGRADALGLRPGDRVTIEPIDPTSSPTPGPTSSPVVSPTVRPTLNP